MISALIKASNATAAAAARVMASKITRSDRNATARPIAQVGGRGVGDKAQVRHIELSDAVVDVRDLEWEFVDKELESTELKK